MRYKYEVVSFPFIPDGTLLNENITARRLVSANSDSYGNNSTNPPCEGWAWENYNDAVNGIYEVSRNIMHISEGEMQIGAGNYPFPGNYSSNSATAKHQLASLYFKDDGQIPDTGCNSAIVNSHGVILPHTIIKHTVYFQPYNCSTEDSISWLYDNTRGRMNSYPFTNNASSIGSKVAYDVQFRPMIILKDEDNGVCAYIHQCNELWSHNIDVESNEPWIGTIIPGGTINYVEAPITTETCPRYYPTGQNDLYNPEEYYHLPPYALVHAPLLNNSGLVNAGYAMGSNEMVEYFHQHQSFPTPQQHHYVIEQPFDLTILNPSEKIVYNPSEVEIDLVNAQSEQVFPTGYSFLTVHGTFPSRTLFEDAEASGMFPDLKTFPAPSTLGPQSSIYRVKSGSTLRIEPCVTIMDAVIEVEEGATLIYCPEYTFGNFTIDADDSQSVIEFCPENMEHCYTKCLQLDDYDFTGEFIVDNNEIWNTSINPEGVLRFANTLRITSGYTLTLEEDLQLLFGPNGKIIVEVGAKLNINGAFLGSTCDTWWHGIEVLGNSSLNQNPANQGSVRVTNNGVIKNAKVGISLGHVYPNSSVDLSTTGGYVITSTGASFQNCQRSIAIYDYVSPSNINNLTSISNTTFEISEELPDGLLPGHQVYMRGVRGIQIKNSTFKNTRTDDHSILQAGSGIAATKSNFVVEGNVFSNLNNAIRVKSPSFDHIEISENEFDLNHGGILI